MRLGWSHIVVRCRDLDAMVSFYCEMLGFHVADRGPLGPNGVEIVFLTQSSSDHHQIAFVGSRGPEEASSLEHAAFRVDSIGEVKEMIRRIAEDDRVKPGAPITHGNAISVYFQDPEANGLEVFCDSPWHTKQPAAKGWDPTKSDEEILADVEAMYRDDPEFAPMEDYRRRRARELGEL